MVEWLHIFIMLHWHTDELQPILSYWVTFKRVLSKGDRQDLEPQVGHIGREVGPSNKKFCICSCSTLQLRPEFNGMTVYSSMMTTDCFITDITS